MEYHTFRINRAGLIPGAAEAEQIQENIPVQDCYRRTADIVLPLQKVPVCRENQQWYGLPWEIRTEIPSGSHRFQVWTDEIFFKQRVYRSDQTVYQSHADQCSRQDHKRKKHRHHFSYQSSRPKAAYARLKEECVRMQQVITTKNRFRIFFHSRLPCRVCILYAGKEF